MDYPGWGAPNTPGTPKSYGYDREGPATPRSPWSNSSEATYSPKSSIYDDGPYTPISFSGAPYTPNTPYTPRPADAPYSTNASYTPRTAEAPYTPKTGINNVEVPITPRSNNFGIPDTPRSGNFAGLDNPYTPRSGMDTPMTPRSGLWGSTPDTPRSAGLGAVGTGYPESAPKSPMIHYEAARMRDTGMIIKISLQLLSF